MDLKGAVIEKFFVWKSLDLNGKTYKMQGQYPIGDLNFELIYPEHLVLKLKLQQLNRTCNRHQKFDKNQFFPLPKKHRLADDEQYSNWVKLKLFNTKIKWKHLQWSE
jgi:hypothetical protein